MKRKQVRIRSKNGMTPERIREMLKPVEVNWSSLWQFQDRYRISDDGRCATIKVPALWQQNLYVYTLIDSTDLEKAFKYNLVARIKGENIQIHVNSPKTQRLARFILGIDDPDIFVGYKNRNALDNTRANLELRFRGKEYHSNYGSWRKERDAAMLAVGSICQRCKKAKAVQVHHKLPVRFFENPLDAHFPENLKPVCRRCHKREHRDIANNLPLLNQIRFRKVVKKMNINTVIVVIEKP